MRLTRVLLMFAVACLFVTGCGDDEPSRPKDGSPVATISNIWPNDDGRAWTYACTQRTWGTWGPKTYPTEEDVPPVPTMSEIAAILGSHPIGDSPDTLLGVYRLKFQGSITTPSGVTAQYLTESLEVPGSSPVASAPVSFEKALLARLMVARPDLRDKIAAYAGSGAASLPGPGNHVDGKISSVIAQAHRDPLLIHGYAWKKSDRWIGTYGDLDTLLAWKFLEAPLFWHHEFTHQLLASFMDDLFEHCRILGRSSVQTEAGLFQGALECLYVIDYGILTWTDEYGNFMGYSRLFDYGTVVYAPNVGPVYSYERWMVEPGDSLTTGMGDLTLSLVNTGVSGY